jgi:peptidoglycan/LPS O-acetylase OafA/YrhL
MNVQTMVPRMSGVFNARPAYRPDIDGLRALAVSMVLIYHAFPTWLPAGFLGVDVFFVISGFLITQLVSGALRAGTFSLLQFYQRRVRRIVPALLLILGSCAAFGWFILTPAELQDLGGAIRWSAPFLANSYFANSSGYFQGASSGSPLLHLWSLGVEEQFYLCWPVLLIAAVRQGVTASVLRAIIAVSLAISIWGAWDSPGVHFFKLASRMWELAAGGLQKLRAIAVAAGAEVVDPADTLCDTLRCTTVTPRGTPLYMDSNHLRPFFARSSALFLDEMLLHESAVPATPGANAMSALSK